MTNIPITKAIFDDDDLSLILEPLRSGWVVQGKFVAEFERGFAGFTGAPHAAAVATCTAGLHIGASILGVQPGDEVLVPAFTWISTANVIEHLGGRAVFVDIDPHTFNIDVADAASKVTSRTVGIVPVHLFGLAADMDAVMALAARHGLWVMEDAACGFDTWYKGRHVGTIGDLGAFSFHPRKSITTGEGGMITARTAAHDAMARTLRDHGASRSDLERHTAQQSFLLAEYRHLGFNFRMTDMQGALGVTQLRKSGWIQSQRRQVAAWYDARLRGTDWLATPFRHPDYVHGQQGYVCTFQPETLSLESIDRVYALRNAVMSAMESQGITTRQGTHAPPFLQVFREKYGHVPGDFPNAYIAERASLTLPMYAGMTEAEVDRVVESLQHAVADLGATVAAR